MDLTHHITKDKIQEMRGQFKKVFFYRICGTGMGAAACLLKEQGFAVEGGDLNYFPPMSDYLKSTGIPCHDLETVTSDFLKSFDLIVVGNVVPRQSEVAREIEKLGVPFCSFPAALGGLLLGEINVVGVAGTHGKTTTTWFFAQMFKQLGFDAGYFVGGVIPRHPSSHLGDGKYFFIESDEYDSAYFEKISKFRLYDLNTMILTSLEFDHADIFSSIEDIKDQFRAVLPGLGENVIYDDSYQAACELQRESNKNWLAYGNSSTGPQILKEDKEGTTFSLQYNGKSYDFTTSVIGKHNILNLSSCILYAFSEGLSYEAIEKSVKDVELVKRRQEVRGKINGALVIDDFAHHPRAVDLTLSGLKTRFPGMPLKVVLEPTSATARSSLHQDTFVDALKIADEVCILNPAKDTTAKNLENLDSELLIKKLGEQGVPGQLSRELSDLIQFINSNVKENDLLVFLSNGTCQGFWESDLAKNLD